MKKILKWINYKIDILISKGFIAQFLILFSSIGIIVFVFGLIAKVISRGLPFWSAVWQALMHIIDQGTISGDETGDLGYIVIMLIVTFLGMAFTGTIVGIINNAMTIKLEELKKGHSQIIESKHVVVIGFDENIYTILSQMEASNENNIENKKIVVVDEKPKEEMEQLIREHYKSLNHSNYRSVKRKFKHVLFRTGNTISDNTFEMASVESARAIIINNDDDFEVIRILLAIVSYFNKPNAHPPKSMPSIVTLMHEKENIDAAKIAAGIQIENNEQGSDINAQYHISDVTPIRILYFEQVLAHIFAEVCRQPGLSWVISEIFDYQGSEVYIESLGKYEKDVVGRTFGDICEMMVGSTAIGIQRDKEIILNPNPQTERIITGDKIIHLAVDDNRIKIDTNLTTEYVHEQREKENKKERFNLLVFGWSTPLPEILKNINAYASEKGSYRIFTRHTNDEAKIVCPYYKKRRRKSEYKIEEIGNLPYLDYIPEPSMDPYDWATISKLIKDQGIFDNPEDPNFPTNILILCQDGIDKVEADERAAVLLLNIRNFLVQNELDEKITVTTEMNLPEDQKLLQHTSINDFIVGAEIANRMMVQVANNTDIYTVFWQILNAYGSGLYLRDVAEYVNTSDAFTFYDIERSARSRACYGDDNCEIALGWIQVHKEGRSINPKVKLNPVGDEKDKKFPISKDNYKDYQIVILGKNNKNCK